MAKRVIIKTETIPNTGKLLGQTSIVNKTGGNVATNFNSTNIFNFDVKDEGEIGQKDPQKSYLTTTFYPLIFTDKLQTSAQRISRAVLTDNLYTTHGLSDEMRVTATNVQVVLKRILYSIDYYSNSYAKRDAFFVKASQVTLNFRNVLRTYEYPLESFKTRSKSVSFLLRSVLILYTYYKPENIKVFAKSTSVSVKTFSNKFSSVLLGDSKNVGTIINNDVMMIKDKGQLTWTFSDNIYVSKESRFEENSLSMEESSSYLKSNESLNITSEDGVEIFFEDWIKPVTCTKTLLTSYNSIKTLDEKPLLQDKIDSIYWTVSGSDFNPNLKDIVLKETTSIKKVVGVDRLILANPITGSKGTTVELNCKVEGTDRIYLLSNNASALSTSLKENFAVVWHGENTSQTSVKNRVTVISDDPDLTDAQGNLVVSLDTFPTGSNLDIKIIFYNMYLKLFVNGVLQGVRLINRDFNLGYSGAVKLGKVNWYQYTVPHTYTVKSLRISDMALHLGNTYEITDPYNMTAIPDLARLSEASKYHSGISCGLRYKEDTNEVVAFASITDTDDVTFTAESSGVDITKWNYLQLSNTGSDITLFINGVSNAHMILPYNIKFKDILIGAKETNNYKGRMDNFRIYSKIRDESNPCRASELLFKLNGLENTSLKDSNNKLLWKRSDDAYFQNTSNNTYRNASYIGGMSTTGTNLLLNPYKFENTLVLDNKSYKTSADLDVIEAETTFNNTPLSYETPFNLSEDALKIVFKVTNTSTSSLLIIGNLSVSVEGLTQNTYKIVITINGISKELPYTFTKDFEYSLLTLKLGRQVTFFVNGSKVYEEIVQTLINSTTIAIGNFIGSVSKLTTSNNILTKTNVLETTDENTGYGYYVEMYEPIKDNFVFSNFFSQNARSISSDIAYTGSNKLSFKFKNSTLYASVNGIENDGTKTEFTGLGEVLYILKENKTPLEYFQSIVSEQDALLPVPYKLENLFNESVYSKAVLALSTDSDYGNSYIFDRSSAKVAKDVINTDVVKGMHHPGFYFKGSTSHLKVSSDDFSFGLEDFYMDFEVYLNSLAEKSVILDRLTDASGTWQLSINTNGEIFFTISSGVSTTPYTVTIPANLRLNKWYKIQVSRKGSVFRFFLNDTLIYEYSSGSVIDFDKKDVDLYVGCEGNNGAHRDFLKGYLNNLRIVKGSSIDVETDEELLAIEKIKENPKHKAVSDAVLQLTGVSEYTLEGDSIRYLKPPTGSPYLYKVGGGSPAPLQETPEKACEAYVGFPCTTVNVESSGNVVGCWGSSGQTCGSVANRIPNPNYTEAVDALIPLSSVAQKILLNAELEDVSALTFLGVKGVVPETYNIYKTSSDTLFNIYANENEFYDSKGGVWTGTSSLQVEEGKAPEYNSWLKLSGNITTSTKQVFTNTSELLLESSFALGTQLSTDKELMSFGNLLKISLTANNIGLKITFNGVLYTISHLFRDDVWYKFALCYKNENLYIYIDDFKYLLPYNKTTWSTTATSVFTLHNGTTRFEAVKLSSKCPYKDNKGRDNLYLDTHLLFEKNDVDNGNKKRDVGISLAETITTVKPFFGLKSKVMSANSLITVTKGISVATSPFSLELTVKFSNLGSREVIASFSTLTTECILYKDIDDKIKFDCTFEDETTTYANNTLILKDTWVKLNLSRDLSNILSISVSKTTESFLNFNYDLTETDLLVGGFTGHIYEVKLFSNYSIISKEGINLLKLDFEEDSLTTNYVVDSYNKRLVRNFNVSPIKGLSKTSDYVGYFDGVSSYLNIQKDPFLNFGKDFFEISFSVYPSSGANTYQTIFANSSVTGTDGSPYIIMYGAEQPVTIPEPAAGRIGVGNSAIPFLLSNKQLAYNVWADIKLVHENGVYSLYINDILDKVVTTDSTFNLNSSDGTYIGKSTWNGSEGYFQGYLDNIKIARDSYYQESTEIYVTEGLISGLDFEEVGSGFDVVENDIDGNTVDTYSNAWLLGRYDSSSKLPYYRTVSAINDAIHFIDKGYMYCYNKHFAMGLDPFTISLAFNQTKRSTSDAFLLHVYGLYAIVITPSGYLEVDIGGTRTRVGLVNLDTFYTIAITRDSNYTLRIFLDGVIMSMQPNMQFNSNFGTDQNQPMCLGTRFDTRGNSYYVGNYFIGFLDNFIFDRGTCRYDKEYAVYMDKSEKIKNNSLVEFQNDGITSFPDLATPSLQWTSSGITTVSVGTKYTTFAGQNLLNTGYMDSTAHGWQLGNKDFSLDLVLKPRQTAAEACALDLSLNTGITEGLRVLQSSSSPASFTVEIGSTGASSWSLSLNTGANTLAVNTVYHLRITRNLGTIYLYLNGVLRDYRDFTDDINIGSTISLFNNKARNRGFTGTVEQFRFIEGSAVAALTSFTEIIESLK